MNIHKALYSLGFKKTRQIYAKCHPYLGDTMILLEEEHPRKNVSTFVYSINSDKRIVLNLSMGKSLDMYLENLEKKISIRIQTWNEDPITGYASPIALTCKRDIINLMPKNIQREMLISNLFR